MKSIAPRSDAWNCAAGTRRLRLSKIWGGAGIPVPPFSNSGQLPGHLNRALNNGVTREELIEAITHLSFYSGWPTALTAATIAKDVFEARED